MSPEKKDKKETIQDYLQGRFTQEGKAMFDQWFFSEREQDTGKLTDELGEAMMQKVRVRLAHSINQTKYQHPLGRRWRLILSGQMIKYAAVLLLLIVAGASFWYVQSYTDWMVTYHQYTTSAGQRAHVMLADGTQVRMNENSTLRYPKHFLRRSSRAVKLEGEAYFEVVKNPEKPFVITTEQASIRVLGTTFNVKETRDTTVVVAVVEGRVVLASREAQAQKVELTQGETGILSAKEVAQKQVNDIHNYLSWFNRRIIFNNTSLPAVAQQLEQIYDVSIELRDEALYNMVLTADTERVPVGDLLQEITITLNVGLSKTQEGYALHLKK